jgi:hypothetical protein
MDYSKFKAGQPHYEKYSREIIKMIKQWQQWQTISQS